MGKRDFWMRGNTHHYHVTLDAGENTLEAQLCRVLMKTVVAKQGAFDAAAFQEAYITFMTTPGSHNDTYASTCHRMFFENLVTNKLPPSECPSNDGHNVDTMDGLVLPIIVALATVSDEQTAAIGAVTACVGTTRSSPQLAAYASLMTDMVRSVVVKGEALPTAAKRVGERLGVNVSRSPGNLMTS